MVIPDYRKESGEWFYRPTVNGKQIHTLSSLVWENIQSRCRVGGAEQERYPRYKGCFNSFTNYQEFVEWHIKQLGYGCGWQIDKDLLVKGNLEYSPDNCVLLPQELNSLIVKCNARRGKYPIGVFWDKKASVFVAACAVNEGAKSNRIGQFLNPVDAFNCYKVYKEEFIKQQAEKWKSKIDPRAYEALINYQVEITD